MSHDELVDLFERIQARPNMYFFRGVEFWVLVGSVKGMKASGVSEMEGFQEWVSQTLYGWPISPIIWESIIAERVTKGSNRLQLTDQENQEAFQIALTSLISYLKSKVRGR